MIKNNKIIKDLRDLTENHKDKILEYIRIKEVSIKNAALELNVTAAVINKIFTERFDKRNQRMKDLKNKFK